MTADMKLTEEQRTFLMDIINEFIIEGLEVSSKDLEYLYSRYLAGRTPKQIVSDYRLKIRGRNGQK